MIQKVKDWKKFNTPQFTWDLSTASDRLLSGESPGLLALRLKDNVIFWRGVDYELGPEIFYRINKFNDDMINVEIEGWSKKITIFINKTVEINRLLCPKQFIKEPTE